MSADRRRRRQPAGSTVVIKPDLAAVGALLRQAGFVGCGDDPVSARGRCNPDGSLRTIKARYPGGWCCRLTRHVNGTYSVTQSISITVAGSPRGLA